MSNETNHPTGQAQAPSPSASINDSRRKSPVVACILSLMPGLGQVYVGYYQRGFLHLIVVATVITVLASGNVMPLAPLFGLFLAFFWLYNVVDAGRRAALYNEVLAGRTDIELPQDLMTPGIKGSVVGGVVIAAFGTVLLMHTRFGMSLAWVEEWWPASLILFGAYLVYKAKAESMKPRTATADDEDF